MAKNDAIHEFDPVIYPRIIWVTVGTSLATLKEVFVDVERMADGADAQVETATTKDAGKHGLLVRFENKAALTTENIAHESTHVAMEIFDYIGATPDLKNQEPFAYLCGWVAKCINEVKCNKK